MKLRSLALNQFKKFTAPVRLDGIADGLNVVVGPNEMGKSTLLDALRAVLFEKHGSRAQPIVALQNDLNQAGPVIELAFELDEELYRITKRFLKKPYARLACPDGRLLEGDAAEDALREKLGFEEAGKTGAKPETIGMWNVLWVQQGQSFGAPDIPEAARSSLHAALESEVGTVLGGRRGRQLPQEIERQLGQLVTSKGQPRGRYKELLEHLDALREKLAELTAHRRELTETLDDLEAAEETLSRLLAGDHDRTDAAERKEAVSRRNQRAELEARINGACIERTLKERDHKSAEQAREDREQLKNEIALHEQHAESARARLAEVTGEEKDLRARCETLRADAGLAESALTGADAAVSLARRVMAHVERAAQIDMLRERCTKAEEAEKRGHEARQKAAAILVSDEAVRQIHSLAAAVEAGRARLDAQATTITFEIDASAFPAIEIDGEPLTAERRVVRAVAPTTIAIEGRGRIFIDPAIKDRAALSERQRDQAALLKRALDAAGAVSPGDADDQHAAKKKFLAEADLAGQEAALYAPATAEYEAGARALADHIKGLSLLLAHELDELALPEWPVPEDAKARLQAMEQRAQEARGELARARARLGAPEQALAGLQTELGAVTARFEEAQRRLQELRRRHALAEQARPESRLLQDIATAREAFLVQAARVTGLESERTEETLDELDGRIARLEEAIRHRAEKRLGLREKIAGLKSRLEALDGAGLDEVIQRTSREIELYERESRSCEREREILELLLSTLRAAERDAKERVLSPVLRRVRPYLQFLFPGAEITIDEDLQITGIMRVAGHNEKFQRLSMGTQEQIAVLARLALAEMLVEQGSPATVILDDALVFSDDRRMSRMFDVLNAAARKLQIIIFTCREQLFDGLGGRQLSLAPGRDEELISA